MSIRLFPFDLSVILLATLCCLSASAQDPLSVNTQPERSVPRSRPGRPRVPTSSCPELEELGYQFRRLFDVELDIRLLDTETPADCSVNLFRPAGTENLALDRVHTQFSWVPTELYYKPLYFEDAILERTGQFSDPLLQPLQPLLSAAHFFGTFPVIPYQIGLDRPHDRVYALGHYRPGSPAPCLGNRLPLEVDAATFEAVTWVSLFFLLP